MIIIPMTKLNNRKSLILIQFLNNWLILLKILRINLIPNKINKKFHSRKKYKNKQIQFKNLKKKKNNNNINNNTNNSSRSNSRIKIKRNQVIYKMKQTHSMNQINIFLTTIKKNLNNINVLPQLITITLVMKIILIIKMINLLRKCLLFQVHNMA